MEGQAKVHTMRIFTSGTLDADGKKVADRTFKYSLSKVWEEADINNIRTANISAQQVLRKYAEAQNEDGSYKHTDSECITYANTITFASVAPGELQRGKTDMEKAAELFAKLTPEESAMVIKADKERRKETVAA